MSVCPATGVKDFPIQNDVPITGVLNESVTEVFSLQFRFAPRSDVPHFLATNQGVLDEGINRPGEASQNTLRLRGNDYHLRTVQITSPLHSNFLPTSIKDNDLGEIVMIFQNASGLGNTYCIICIPLIGQETQDPPAYLDAILNDRLPNKPISLEGLLPGRRGNDFVSYVTCLPQVKEQNSTATQVQVFVFISGLAYDSSKISELRNSYFTKPGRNNVPEKVSQKNFADVFLPDSLIAKTSTRPFRLANESQYKSYIRYGLLPQSATREQKTNENRRIDSTDSYQCVPLNPDVNVKDNTIVIDTDKGTPLSQVLKEKADDQDVGGGITPGAVERMIAVIIGTILGLFILSILAYLFILITSKNGGPAFPWLRDQYKNMIPTVFIAIVVGATGFLIGYFTQNMVNK